MPNVKQMQAAGSNLLVARLVALGQSDDYIRQRLIETYGNSPLNQIAAAITAGKQAYFAATTLNVGSSGTTLSPGNLPSSLIGNAGFQYYVRISVIDGSGKVITARFNNVFSQDQLTDQEVKDIAEGNFRATAATSGSPRAVLLPSDLTNLSTEIIGVQTTG